MERLQRRRPPVGGDHFQCVGADVARQRHAGKGARRGIKLNPTVQRRAIPASRTQSHRPLWILERMIHGKREPIVGLGRKRPHWIHDNGRLVHVVHLDDHRLDINAS